MSIIQVSKFTYTSTNLSPSSANTMNTKKMSGDSCIMELFGFCKGGNFNMHILAWFGSFICSKREIRFYLLVKSYYVVLVMQTSVIFMKILTIYTLNLRLLIL